MKLAAGFDFHSRSIVKSGYETLLPPGGGVSSPRISFIPLATIYLGNVGPNKRQMRVVGRYSG